MIIGVDIDDCLTVPENLSFFEQLSLEHQVHLVTARSYMDIGATIHQLERDFNEIKWVGLHFFREEAELESFQRQELNKGVFLWSIPSSKLAFHQAKGLIASSLGLEKFYDDWPSFLAWMPDDMECILVRGSSFETLTMDMRLELREEMQKPRRSFFGFRF